MPAGQNTISVEGRTCESGKTAVQPKITVRNVDNVVDNGISGGSDVVMLFMRMRRVTMEVIGCGLSAPFRAYDALKIHLRVGDSVDRCVDGFVGPCVVATSAADNHVGPVGCGDFRQAAATSTQNDVRGNVAGICRRHRAGPMPPQELTAAALYVPRQPAYPRLQVGQGGV